MAQIIDPTQIANELSIIIRVRQTPQGDKMDIDVSPPNQYADATLSYLQRAVAFYERALQTGHLLQTMNEQAVAAMAQRGPLHRA